MITNICLNPLNCEKIFNKILEAVEIVQTSNRDEKNVIIFDIDDTLIFNNSNNIITPVYDFFKWIQQHNIIPVIITARSGETFNIKNTLEQLHGLDIKGYRKIFFRPKNDMDLLSYKRNCRRSLINEGYNVLMSIGDMPWDIGEYGGHGILLR